MTLPRLASMTAYWKLRPPTHIIAGNIAVALGMKQQNQQSGKIENEGELPEFATLPEYEE